MDLKVFQDTGVTVWHWLYDKNNRETVTWIVGGVVVVVGVVWKLFTKERNPKPTAPGIYKDSLPPLVKRLSSKCNDKAKELAEMGDVFSDPVLLSKYYVVPNCQHHNPADFNEDDDARFELRKPFFEYISDFLEKAVTLRNGSHQLFILADAGMGKTSAYNSGPPI